MKPRLVFVAVGTLLGLALADARHAAAIDKAPPKVSAKETFKPSAVRKLALIVSGPQKSQFLASQPQTDQQRLVEDEFLGALIEKNYDVAVRSDLEKILGEQKLQKSGLTDADSVEIGKLLNVPAVLLIHISELNTGGRQFGAGRNPVAVVQSTASLGARLVDVKSGSVLWTGTHRVEIQVSDRRSSDALVKAADELAEAFPKRDPAEPAAETPAPDRPERGQRLVSAFVAGSVWEGTQVRAGEEASPIDVKWIVKEREGDKFRAEIVLPMRTITIEGTVSAGVISWKTKTADGRDTPQQTLRIRGRTIRGTINRMGPGGTTVQMDLNLTLKSE